MIVLNSDKVFFDLIPYEIGILILAGFVMMILLTIKDVILLTIKDVKEKNKICQKCQNEIKNHR